MQFLRADLWRWPIDVSIACLAFSAVKWWSHDDPVFEGGSADTNGTCPECAYWPSTGCCSGKGRVGSNCKNRSDQTVFSKLLGTLTFHGSSFSSYKWISTISIFWNFLSRGSVLETARSMFFPHRTFSKWPSTPGWRWTPDIRRIDDSHSLIHWEFWGPPGATSTSTGKGESTTSGALASW